MVLWCQRLSHEIQMIKMMIYHLCYQIAELMMIDLIRLIIVVVCIVASEIEWSKIFDFCFIEKNFCWFVSCCIATIFFLFFSMCMHSIALEKTQWKWTTCHSLFMVSVTNIDFFVFFVCSIIKYRVKHNDD
jgi:hypothetical protein